MENRVSGFYMGFNDYKKFKDLTVDSVSGSPSVDKAQPIIVKDSGPFFDVSSASFTQGFDVSSEDGLSTGVVFNDSGSKMFVAGKSKNNVYEYSLGTSFDVSSASFTQSFDVSSEDTLPEGLAFNSDGAEMFVVGRSNDNIYEYEIGVSENITGNGDIVIDPSGLNGTLGQPDGKSDIAVYDENKNLLDFEIENPEDIGSGTIDGELVLWVYKSSWIRDGTVQAKLVYGNGPSSAEDDTTGTWNNTGQNTVLVQHFNENNYPSDTAIDSGPNSIDGAVTGVKSREGQFDGSASYDGVDDQIDFNGTAVDNNFPEGQSSTNMTFIAWTKLDSTVQNKGAIVYYDDNDGSGGDGWFFRHEGSKSPPGTDNSVILRTEGGNTGSSTISAPTGEFALTGFTWKTGTEAKLFINEQTDTTPITDTSSVANGTTAHIGYTGHSEGHHEGDIDAARLYTGVKDSDWIQAEFDASPKGGQVFFSQAADQKIKIVIPPNTASGTAAGKTISISGSTKLNTTECISTAAGKTIFIEPDFATLSANGPGGGETISVSGISLLEVTDAEATGGAGPGLNLQRGLLDEPATATATGGATRLDRLKGSVDVEGQPTSGVDVNVIDKTNNILHQTTTDSNGDWIVDSGDGIKYQVAYLFDDGSTFYGDAEENDTT